MSAKKSAVKTKPAEQPSAPETPPEPVQSTPDAHAIISEPCVPIPTPPLTLKYLHQELESLKQVMTELQEALARKRKPVQLNGKVQIRDKQTGTIYPSKNNAYQTLLKSDELKTLADKGILGPVPAKNTFGWYALVREWPDRFEEVHDAQNA